MTSYHAKRTGNTVVLTEYKGQNIKKRAEYVARTSSEALVLMMRAIWQCKANGINITFDDARTN